MPHSSGGGSHGGGSHHSSSHHSSGGGGGGGRSSPRVSTTRFAGSQRYAYYDRHRRVHYIYCAKNPRKAFRPRWALIIIYIPFIFALFSMAGEIVHVPKKVSNSDSKIVIEDTANVIKNEGLLTMSLRAFYNDSGVTPAVVTLYNEDWQGKYKTLEKYAYDKYIKLFGSNEKHWLVVYSIPREPKYKDFKDWYWEGMIGDSVGSMITEANEDFFTDRMQRYLTDSDRYSIESAISNAFKDTLAEAQKTSFDASMIPIILFMGAFITFHAMMMIGLTPKNLKYWRAQPAPEPEETVVRCSYCDGVFKLGQNTTCPNCGANLDITKAVPINQMRY